MQGAQMTCPRSHSLSGAEAGAGMTPKGPCHFLPGTTENLARTQCFREHSVTLEKSFHLGGLRFPS